MFKRVLSVAPNALHSIKPAIKEKPQFALHHFEVVTRPFFLHRSDLKFVNDVPVHTNSIKIALPFPSHSYLSLFQRDRLARHIINRTFVMHFSPERKTLF